MDGEEKVSLQHKILKGLHKQPQGWMGRKMFPVRKLGPYSFKNKNFTTRWMALGALRLNLVQINLHNGMLHCELCISVSI